METKRLVIFDLDGTLTPSKSNMDADMGAVLCKLLEKKKIAIISGGHFEQYKNQFLDNFDCPEDLLPNLFLLPISGSHFLSWNSENKEWETIYKEDLTKEEKEKIFSSLEKSIAESGFEMPEKAYGEITQDRESQISFSANGQEAPIEVKGPWDPDGSKRRSLIKVLNKYIPEFEVRIGGTNTIDITKKGVDKAYGVEKLSEYTGIPFNEMFFIGDHLEEGGNDSSVLRLGIEAIDIEGPEETKRVIEERFLN